MKSSCYCVKCKRKQSCECVLKKDKRGRPRMEGTCPSCRTRVFKYVSKSGSLSRKSRSKSRKSRSKSRKSRSKSRKSRSKSRSKFDSKFMLF